MRKHDVRKWLHAILDLLPVIIIPVFMIYSHRHTIDSYSIDVSENKIVDFNQQNYNGRPDNFDNLTVWSYYGGSLTFSDYEFTFVRDTSSDASITYGWNNSERKQLDNVYYFSFIYRSNYDFNLQSISNFSIPSTNSKTKYSQVFTYSSSVYAGGDYFYNYNSSESDWVLTLCDYQLINLTQMFGSGNEPTLQQFNAWYQNDYYDYTLSHKELLKDFGTITYDDTDIGSQMLYCLYNSVDKYFNLNNVFGFNNVYDWLSLNIFNGNPPIAIYIVWNIALYEFLMDLIMLLYALFMWFIDMCESLIDRSFHVASGRKK